MDADTGPFRDLRAARDELAETLVDVLAVVLCEEAAITEEPVAAGPAAIGQLAIRDDRGAHGGVEIRLGLGLARVLAARMMAVAAPDEDDVVDAVAELGNIAGGSAKTLLCERHSELSLPRSTIVDAHPEPEVPGAEQVRAVVLGHVVALTVVPGAVFDGLIWPPVVTDELMGRL